MTDSGTGRRQTNGIKLMSMRARLEYAFGMNVQLRHGLRVNEALISHLSQSAFLGETNLYLSLENVHFWTMMYTQTQSTESNHMKRKWNYGTS